MLGFLAGVLFLLLFLALGQSGFGLLWLRGLCGVPILGGGSSRFLLVGIPLEEGCAVLNLFL